MSAVVDRWVDDLAIKIGRPREPSLDLSGGNQQRVVLAKWLATGRRPHPRFADRRRRRRRERGYLQIVIELAEQGLAILLISDEAPEVYFNADRILHMAGGRIIAEYDPRNITLDDLEGPSMRSFFRTIRTKRASSPCFSSSRPVFRSPRRAFFSLGNLLRSSTPVGQLDLGSWAAGRSDRWRYRHFVRGRRFGRPISRRLRLRGGRRRRLAHRLPFAGLFGLASASSTRA